MMPSTLSHAAAGRQYLLRFDDLCPTMNWRVWRQIEEALVRLSVKPIVAVIPDNCDPKLHIDPPEARFWDHVRHWQSLGWAIALHGHQHRYVNENPGMLRINRQSEFAGLSYDDQRRKLQLALEIFERERVHPSVWVAPSHSFDPTTLRALLDLGVDTVSDGLWTWPHQDAQGIMWVPQQLWGRVKPKGQGVWTVCYHHNSWTEAELARFQTDIETYAAETVTLDSVCAQFAARRAGITDHVCAWLRRQRYTPVGKAAKQALKSLLG